MHTIDERSTYPKIKEIVEYNKNGPNSISHPNEPFCGFNKAFHRFLHPYGLDTIGDFPGSIKMRPRYNIPEQAKFHNTIDDIVLCDADISPIGYKVERNQFFISKHNTIQEKSEMFSND